MRAYVSRASPWENPECSAETQARAAARRARENKRFFSGVDKAFGKKAGNAMLAAFNGKAKNVLTKFKLNEKKLDAQKEKIADNTVVPSHKHAAHHKVFLLLWWAVAEAFEASRTKLLPYHGTMCI